MAVPHRTSARSHAAVEPLEARRLMAAPDVIANGDPTFTVTEGDGFFDAGGVYYTEFFQGGFTTAGLYGFRNENRPGSDSSDGEYRYARTGEDTATLDLSADGETATVSLTFTDDFPDADFRYAGGTFTAVDGNGSAEQGTFVLRYKPVPLPVPISVLRGRTVFVQLNDSMAFYRPALTADGEHFDVSNGGYAEVYRLDEVDRLEVQAGGGNDHITIGDGLPDTYVFGGAGNDVLIGGSGDDTLSGGSGKNYLYGMGGNDRLQGSNGRDYLDGGEGDDRLYGDLDRDRDTGRGGNDTIFGGAGRDNIFAGAGDDYIDGGTSNDPIRADFGDDTIFGGRGRDILDGGPGRNLVLRSDLDDADELADDSDLLLGITIVDELERLEPLFVT